MRHHILFTLALTMIILAACQKNTPDGPTHVELNLPEQPYDYSLTFPEHFEGHFPVRMIQEVNSFDENPIVTDHGATLGRVLFYDPHLSLNNSISCASCHHQDKAFADGLRVSTGFEGRVTDRNSMAITNVALIDNLFWDSRATSVSDLTLKPVQNHIEMGMEDLDHLSAKLSKLPHYTDLFTKAFGNADMSSENISNALAQFLCSIQTHGSKYDQEALSGFTNFSSLEQLGMELFFSNQTQCASCHAAPNFSGLETSGQYQSTNGTANIGLDVVYADQGRGNGKFRIPSLRNIALTGPYMHDGRFETLMEVIEHYDHGVQPHPELDPKFIDKTTGQPKNLNLSRVEKEALVAFLHTLTDYEMLNDERYSNPFVQ